MHDILNPADKRVKFVQALLSAWAVYLFYLPVKLKSNNFIYAVGQIHTYDSSLFVSNVYLSDNGISPRYLLDSLFALFMKLNGGNWAETAYFFLHIGVFTLAVATAVLSFQISEKNEIPYAVIVALFFVKSVGGKIAGFDTFPAATIGIGMGYALAILAIALVVGEKKYFNIAWCILGLAVVFHVHEGLYGAAAVFLLLLTEIISSRKLLIKENRCALFCFAILVITIIPNMLTDPLTIASKEFIDIYAVLRHPHHLQPSVWGLDTILKSFLLLLYPACFRLGYLFLYEKEHLKKFIIEILLFSTAWLGALGVMYIGIEKLQVPVITTMYFSKFFKYVSVLSLVWHIKTAENFFARHKPVAGVFLLLFAGTARFMGFYAIPVFLGTFGCIFLLRKEFWRGNISLSPDKDNTNQQLSGQNTFAESSLWNTTGGFYRTKQINRRIWKFLSAAFTVVFLIYCSYEKLWQISDNKPTILSPSEILVNTCGKDIGQLARSLNEQTTPEESFLADPRDENSSGWMQVISERNCYVNPKVIPSFKSQIGEWYKRYQPVRGLFEKDVAEIADVMRTADTDYLLVRSDDYERMENSDLFERFITCDGDSYRIYRLIF